MLTRFVNWLTIHLFTSHQTDQRRDLIKAGVFLFPFLTILAIAIFNCFAAYYDLTSIALERRQSLAHISTISLKERLDRITELGVSLASRVRFRELIKEGEWTQAAAILKEVPKEFSYIERISLMNISGTMMADTPSLPGGLGKNFAERDWYQGVSHQWKPYVSEVFKRTSEPQHNVVAVAIPIRGEGGNGILGILVLQIKLDTFLAWSRQIEVGPSGFLYFVDQKGRLVAHPKVRPQDPIVDFSSVPAVQKALSGKRGVKVSYNPIEKEDRLAAYEMVPIYNWGVIIQQPVAAAFAKRNLIVGSLAAVYILILILNYFLIMIIRQTFDIIQSHRQRLQDNQNRFNVLIDSAWDAIITADSEGKIVSWNRAAERIFGYSISEIVGRSIETIMPERYRAQHEAGMKRFNETGEAQVMGRILQMAGLRKTGQEFPLEISISHWKTDGQKFFTAIIRDISERNKVT